MPDDRPTLDFTVDGTTYHIDFNDITGREAKLFRQAVGTSLLSALQGVSSGELDPLECVAGFKWLMDRKVNPKLTLDEVLDSLTYESLSFEEVAEADEEEVPLENASGTDSPPSPPSTESDPGSSTSSPSARSLSSSAS